MKVYEFRCTECKDQIVTQHYLEGHASLWGHIGPDPEELADAACGPLKRVWSGAFVWPANERGHHRG